MNDVQANLPLTETTFFILLSLLPGPRHGYAIMKDVQALSSNRIVFSTGTLYGALKRLLEDDWIERSQESPELDETGRVRKFYALTQKGRRILESEVSRLRGLVQAASQRATGEQTA